MVQKFGVCKMFLKKDIVTKAAFIWSKYSKPQYCDFFFFNTI